MKLTIGTRGSALAMTQARDIRRRLEALGHEIAIKVIKTTGDKDQKSPFALVGAPGVFVREIENALIEGQIDVAVHCYKDLPSVGPEELVIAAMPDREDQSDTLFMPVEAMAADGGFLPLAQGAQVGTASARRIAFLKHERADISTAVLRGNVPTRIAKLLAGEHDAIVLATAGVRRLEAAAARGELEFSIPDGLLQHQLDPTRYVPAASQGALALQVRKDDVNAHEVIALLDKPTEHEAVRVERKLLALVDGGCQLPFGAWCRHAADGSLELFSALERDGEVRRAEARGTDPESLAQEAFATLLPELTGRA